VKTEYMYLWVRRDLSQPQQIVQASHAAAEIGRHYHSDTNIVLCDAVDELDLLNVSQYLLMNDIEHIAFYEPDIEGHTAIATQPLLGNQRRPLRRFSLMK
jgi:hypothetical protein